MKVGVYLDSYSPQDGGAHTFQGGLVDALLRIQKESEHEFHLFFSANANSAVNYDEEIPLTHLRAPNIFQKAHALIARNWPNYRKRFKWRDVAEVQMRKEGIDFLWFLSARPKDLDLPYLAVVWDLQHRLQPWFPEVSEFGQWEIRERGYQRFLGRAAGIITGAQAGKDEISLFYRIPEERILILPHPTPDFALQGDSLAAVEIVSRFGLKENFLLYPAQFWTHKNHVGILKALRILKEEHNHRPDLALVGADFGNLGYVKEKAKQWGLADQLHFLGFVESEDLLQLYKQAGALIYLSTFGPENLPPLEAMALGCPVIAADVDGAQEQFGDAAIRVDPFKPDQAAKAMLNLHKDQKLRNQLISRGRKRAASWTSEDFVRGVFAYFDQFEIVRDLWGQ